MINFLMAMSPASLQRSKLDDLDAKDRFLILVEAHDEDGNAYIKVVHLASSSLDKICFGGYACYYLDELKQVFDRSDTQGLCIDAGGRNHRAPGVTIPGPSISAVLRLAFERRALLHQHGRMSHNGFCCPELVEVQRWEHKVCLSCHRHVDHPNPCPPRRHREEAQKVMQMFHDLLVQREHSFSKDSLPSDWMK